MFIRNDLYYQTDLVDINNVRYLLFTNLYGNSVYIQKLTDIIASHIECLSIDYSPMSFTFTIKIKKTAMRRMHGFKHEPRYYYQEIPEIFMEFIRSNEQVVANCLRTKYEDPYAILQQLYNSPFIMANLCHVSCIADNIIVIKL